MIERKKVWAIAGSAGGTNCAGGAGVRYQLAERGHPLADIEANISGNIPNAAYAIASQLHLGLKIWAEDLPSEPDFIRWERTGEILSVDTMVDQVFAKKRPLHRDALRDTRTRFFFAATDVASRKTKFFTNEDVQAGIDPLEIIRAGTALVGLTRKRPVRIGGKLYSDGATSTTLKDCIQLALDAGAEFVVAIDSNPPEERREFLAKFSASGWSDKVALLQPESNATMVTNNPDDLKEAFYAGFRTAAQHPLIHDFFNEATPTSARSAA